jgi:hypothetical protein
MEYDTLKEFMWGRVMEDFGYMLFGVAVAVLGIVLTYAYQHRSQARRKD